MKRQDFTKVIGDPCLGKSPTCLSHILELLPEVEGEKNQVTLRLNWIHPLETTNVILQSVYPVP